MSVGRDAFFIGWSPRVAPALRGFLVMLGTALLGGGLLLGFLLGGSTDDPAGPDQAGLPDGPAAFEGVLLDRPYPMVVTDSGRAVLLFGDGKRGAVPGAAGQRVLVTGYRFGRGAIGNVALDAAPQPRGSGVEPRALPLGRWRITGEICDGKCAGGAMRPGTGLAHRACAVLCIDGGLPPVFVATAPVAGSAYLLLANADGGPFPADLVRWTGLRVTLEGEVERLGDLLVFRVAAMP